MIGANYESHSKPSESLIEQYDRKDRGQMTKQMKKQGFNPYLPSWEYIPDGEPYVFDDSVYIYGSHDRFNGYAYCLNDYVCWSAPVDDLADWRYEGVIYRKDR